MAQRRQDPDAPEYTVDEDKAPELTWGDEGGKYEGRKEETGDLLAILEMIARDIQHEMDTAKKDDAAAEAEYEKEKAAMLELLHAQEANKLATEEAVADTKLRIADKEALHAQTTEELAVQESLMATLSHDCTWVETHFESRREKRKTELDALAEAKAILAGADAGDYDQVTLAAAR